VQFVSGSLPTFTIAIRLAWSEAHRLGKPDKKHTGACALVSGCPIVVGNQLDGAFIICSVALTMGRTLAVDYPRPHLLDCPNILV